MISNSGAGSKGWGVRTLFMFAILVATGTVINFFLLPEVSALSRLPPSIPLPG